MRPGSTRTSRPFRTSAAGPARALTRCTASCTRPSSGSPAGPSGSVRRTSGSADAAWIRRPLPPGAFLAALTSAWTTTGLWGPRARDVLAAVTADDVSHEGFGFGTCREIEVGGVVVLASRISYVGELGRELHVPIEQGLRLWDTLWPAGQPHGRVAAGIGVSGTAGRAEKRY